MSVLSILNPGFVGRLIPSGGGCVNLAGSVAATGPTAINRTTGTTATYTANVSQVTAGSTPYTYAWSIVSGPANITSGQGTASILITTTGTGSFVLRLVLGNCGTPTLAAQGTITRVA